MTRFRMTYLPLSRRSFLSLAAAALAVPTAAEAQPLDGRAISFLIGTEGAGAYEAYARLFAGHLGRLLPTARITMEVVPEADGRLAAKRIAEAGPDELTIGLFESALLYAEIESADAGALSLASFNWIGKMAVDERILIASKRSGIRSLAELAQRTEPVIFPASSIASRSAAECFMLDAMLGLPIKPVPGYSGGQRELAMLSGEVQVIVGSYPSQKNMLDQLLRDVAPPQAATLVDLIEVSNTLGRWVAAPPAIPEAELAALRAAFDAVVASPAFLAEAKALDLAIAPLGGAAVQSRLTRLLSRKEELRGLLAEALACGRRRAEGERAC